MSLTERLRAFSPDIAETARHIAETARQAVAAVEREEGKALSVESKDAIAASAIVTHLMGKLMFDGKVPEQVAMTMIALVGKTTGDLVRYAERITSGDVPDTLPSDISKLN